MVELIIRKLFDFRQISVPEKLLELKVSQEAVDRELAGTADRFMTIEPVEDEITTGDIVAVELPDEAEESGNKTVQINMGLGFYDEELEAGLMGLRKGAQKDIPVAGKLVPVCVISVKRRMVPPLTDALIQRLNLEGVSNVEDYRDYLVRQNADRVRQGKEDVLCDFVLKGVLAQSEMGEVNPESRDYCLVFDYFKAQLTAVAARSNDTLEALLSKSMGQKDTSGEDGWQKLREHCKVQVKLSGLARAYADQNGAVFTREDGLRRYQAQAQQLGLDRQQPIDEAQVEVGVMQCCITFYKQAIRDYYADKYQVVLTP